MTPPRIRREERGEVRVLLVDNPQKRNALDFRALDELEAECQAAAADGVRCLLRRGAGQ